MKYLYGCFDCRSIFDRAPQGHCVACQSENIQSLDRLLEPSDEREAWLRRIRPLPYWTRAIKQEPISNNIAAFLTALE